MEKNLSSILVACCNFFFQKFMIFLFYNFLNLSSYLGCRADVNMTVRLVVNCNGMKINSVRE